MSSILEVLDRSKSYLDKREIEKSRIIAETVVAEALQIDRIMIYFIIYEVHILHLRRIK